MVQRLFSPRAALAAVIVCLAVPASGLAASTPAQLTATAKYHRYTVSVSATEAQKYVNPFTHKTIKTPAYASISLVKSSSHGANFQSHNWGINRGVTFRAASNLKSGVLKFRVRGFGTISMKFGHAGSQRRGRCVTKGGQRKGRLSGSSSLKFGGRLGRFTNSRLSAVVARNTAYKPNCSFGNGGGPTGTSSPHGTQVNSFTKNGRLSLSANRTSKGTVTENASYSKYTKTLSVSHFLFVTKRHSNAWSFSSNGQRGTLKGIGSIVGSLAYKAKSGDSTSSSGALRGKLAFKFDTGTIKYPSGTSAFASRY